MVAGMSMSAQNQANMSSPWPGARGSKLPDKGAKRQLMPGTIKTFLLVMALGLVFGGGLAFLFRQSLSQAAKPAAEEQAAQAAANGGAGTMPAAEVNSTDFEEVVPVSQRPGAGSRYQVVEEKAYFFDGPRDSTTNGRYLRRGDVFYAEDETNGFVQTGFVQPNGAQATGWLSMQGLSKLSEEPAPQLEPAAASKQGAVAVARAKHRSTATPASRRTRAGRNHSRKPEGGTRVGTWLRRARDVVRPRDKRTEGSRRNKKKEPCKCQ